MTTVVIAAAGQLGRALLDVLPVPDTVGLTRAEADVTDPASLRRALGPIRPTVVINAAGFTAVDAAESDETAAAAVNTAGAESLARICAELGAGLIHVSTDYVFGGDAGTPYDVDAPTAPRTAYGRTKLGGERLVRAVLPESSWIVRTAWLYSGTGRNFVTTMAGLARADEPAVISVVDDQRGSPTRATDLAAGLAVLAAAIDPAASAAATGRRVPPGVYHYVNAGETTWYGLAGAVFELLGADANRLRPVPTEQVPRPAPRPAYSVLSTSGWEAAGLPAPEPWLGALTRELAGRGTDR